MAIVGINLLYQINEVLEKINSLKLKIEAKQSELVVLEKKYSKEEAIFREKEKEKEIQNIILEQFAQSQVKFLQAESKIRSDIASIVEKSIDTFLNSKNLLKLIEKIKLANNDKEPKIQASLEISADLGLTNVEKAESGVLRVDFGDKSYVLDPENLKEKLRAKLLIAILAK